MAENFFDARKTRAKRGNNFMGGAKEIKQALTPVKLKEPEPITLNKEPEVVPEVMNETPTEVEPKDKLTLKKGFIVGYTDEGNVLFKPFGTPGKLEIVGLVEYSKTIALDLLDEMANTKINIVPSLKEGLTATLTGIKALLTRGEEKVAS